MMSHENAQTKNLVRRVLHQGGIVLEPQELSVRVVNMLIAKTKDQVVFNKQQIGYFLVHPFMYIRLAELVNTVLINGAEDPIEEGVLSQIFMFEIRMSDDLPEDELFCVIQDFYSQLICTRMKVF